MNENLLPEKQKELALHRRMLAVAGGVYLLWWFAVELLLPGTFNPFLSRLFVVSIQFTILLSSYWSPWVRRNLRGLFIASMWLMTIHYYYLFYENGGDINWIVGSFITVTAINFSLLSNSALLSYSLFVVSLSLLMVYLLPALATSVFLPGIVTILIQANLGLRSRLGLIKTLADSNERFQMLFNSTFEGVLVHENGRVNDVNQSLIRMTGFSREELLGRNLFDLIPDKETGAVLESMKHEKPAPFETQGLRKDGTRIDIEVRAKEFYFEGRVTRLVTIQDITDRKRAEKEKIAAMALAENVRLRDEFISLASHELKTPISSLKLQTQLIERDLRKESPAGVPPAKLSNFVSVFNRQIDRLVELVNTMLDVSQVSVGHLNLDLQAVDLSELIQDVVTTLQSFDVRSGIRTESLISVDTPEHLPMQADPSRIKQVIENLLTNAIKYGEGKPIHIRASVEGTQVLLGVEDHGLGIAPEHQQRIFERFERALSGRNISGLGLGLYITRQIVDAHGGSISVKSTLGSGSTFTVVLPRSTH